MAGIKMNKEDLQWQAERDASTLASYQELLGDKQRMNRAIKEASKQAQNLSKRADALRSATKLRTPSKTSTRKK